MIRSNSSGGVKHVVKSPGHPSLRAAAGFAVESLESRRLMSGGTISGTVYNDANGDRARDNGEAAVAGRQVYLDLRGVDAPEAADPVATTDANGNYSFGNLPAGNYLVRPVPQSGSVITSPVWGGKYFVQLGANQVIGGDDFGLRSTAGKTFTVAGQLLVPGGAGGSATVTGYLPDGSTNVTFGSLGVVTMPPSVIGQPTAAVAAPGGNIALTYPTQTVTLSAAGAVVSVVATGPVVVVPVTVNAPTGLGVVAQSPTTVLVSFNDNATNEQGYSIERAASAGGPWVNVLTNPGTPGTGSVAAVDTTVSANTTYYYRVYGTNGSVQSPIAGPVSVTTPPVVVVVPPTGATLSGNVFDDTNANGLRDGAEVGVAGRQVYLDRQGLGVFASGDPISITDANGNYSFAGLSGGNYLIRLLPQAGRVISAPLWGGKYFVQLGTNQTINGEDFGTRSTGVASGTTAGGQILVASVRPGPGPQPTTLSRFNADGSTDVPFGTYGTVTPAGVVGQPGGLSVSPNGNIVLTFATGTVTLDGGGGVLATTIPPSNPGPTGNVPAAGAAWVPFAQMIGQDVVANQYPALTGAGIGVAVIDRGIDYNAPQIGAAKIVFQYNFRDNNSNGLDDYGHGTGVAGVIAANGYTYAGQYNQGVAPGVNLIDLKQESSAGIKAALDWVIANHAAYNIQVVNITDFVSDVVGNAWNPTVYLTELQQIHDMGIFISSPVGNGEAQYGPNLPIDNPARSPYVTGVGGVDLSGGFYADSKRGPGLQLLAPASGVTMPYYLRNKSSVGYDSFDDNYDGAPAIVNYAQGTSWGSAYVAGTAALLKQINPNFTPDQIQQMMKDSGTPVLDPTNNVYYSRLNVQKVVQLAYQKMGL